VSALLGKLSWIGRRRGNRVGPVDASDRAAFRVIGIILLAVTAAVAAYYALDFDFAAYTTFRGPLSTARGTVIAAEPTGTHEPGTKWRLRDERTEIVAVRYRFTDPAGVERVGVSYRPGSLLKPGAAVTVQYPTGRPEVSRIRGYRAAKLDHVPIGLPIVGGVGLVLMAVGVSGSRSRAAYRDD
jgi:hypothetical protein